MTVEDGIQLFNVHLYTLYFTGWVFVSVIFIILWRIKKHFIWGFIFISVLYAPGQFDSIAWNAKNEFAVEAFCMMGIASVFFIFPDARALMRSTGSIFLQFILAIMCLNIIWLVFPETLRFIAKYCGAFYDGETRYPVTGGFLRVQIGNFLWCLLCIGLVYGSYKDFMETDYGQNFFKKVFGVFKMAGRA